MIDTQQVTYVLFDWSEMDESADLIGIYPTLEAAQNAILGEHFPMGPEKGFTPLKWANYKIQMWRWESKLCEWTYEEDSGWSYVGSEHPPTRRVCVICGNTHTV